MTSFVGIDISKETFHACLLADLGEAKKVFTNSAKGFEQLNTWIRNRRAADVHVCMEATGGYWEGLALHLHGAGHRVSVINPARIKAFAQSEYYAQKPMPLMLHSSLVSARVSALSCGPRQRRKSAFYRL
jgi:transposase